MRETSELFDILEVINAEPTPLLVGNTTCISVRFSENQAISDINQTVARIQAIAPETPAPQIHQFATGMAIYWADQEWDANSFDQQLPWAA